MPQARRAVKKWNDFNIPVSYRVNEISGDKLRDASNVHTRQNRLTTRNGLSRFNSFSISGTSASKSISYFKGTDGESHYIAKVGAILWEVFSSSANKIKIGLSSLTKHRGLTLNNRHIISIAEDGLFQWAGSSAITPLGQAAPTGNIALNIGGAVGEIAAGTYTVKQTFYDSTNGFETNAGNASTERIVALGENVEVTGMSTSAQNKNMDKWRLYASKGGGPWYFIAEKPIATTTFIWIDDVNSTQVPPTKHAPPIDGGGKYLTEFNRKLVYTGNSIHKNDVFFSEQDIADAFDDNGDSQTVLNIPGDGDNTGISTGLFSDSVLDPYLVIFKKTSTHIYSEIGGYKKFYTLNSKVGCISNETIEVINGNVYFMSANGWNAIIDGQMAKDEKGNAYTLGTGDIDDIFTEDDFVYALDKTAFSNYHSVYYHQLKQYITFVTQKDSPGNRRAYVYEQDSFGFKPYDFNLNITASMNAQDSAGDDIIMIADDEGFLYTHSIKEARTDVDKDGDNVLINALVYLNWTSGGDDDASYNFRELILKAVNTDNVTVKSWINYRLDALQDDIYSFAAAGVGFILDVSKLDVTALSDGRPIIRARADINRVGTSILIGFKQEVENGDLKIFSAQLNMSKNGNPN